MAFTEFYCNTSENNTNGGSPTGTGALYGSTNGNWSTTTNKFTRTDGTTPANTVTAGDYASVYRWRDPGSLHREGEHCRRRVNEANHTFLHRNRGHRADDFATTRTIKVGGAWNGPNAAVVFPFNFITGTINATNRAGVNFKSGTNYAITAAMTHTVGSATFQGYTTTVGDGGRANIDGHRQNKSMPSIAAP